ncbi:unnamed protein product [Closterium sp. NIES-54]
MPLAECAHFGKHRTAQALYDAVVARYSSPATAALGYLLLPYLFLELYAFATQEDLVTHLRTSNARYRAALPAEFLVRNPPPMYITLNFIVTRLPDSLRAVKDHFLAHDPTALTVDLLEQHLLAAETSAVAVSAARGTPRTPFFEGCSPSPLAPSYASAAAVDVLGAEDVRADSASGKHRSSKGKGGRGGGDGSGGGGGGSSGGGGGSGGGGSGGSGGGSGGFGGGGGGSGGGDGSGDSGSGGGRAGATRQGDCGVTRLPDSLRSVKDHFLSLDPTSLTVDLLEQYLLAAETSAIALGAARGTPRPPFFEGCFPSPLAPSYASAAAADVSVAEDVGAAPTSAKRRRSKGKGGRGGGGGSGGGGGGSGSGGGGSSGGGGGGVTVGGSGGSSGGGGGSGGSGGSGGGGTGSGGSGTRRVGSGGGQRQQQQRRSETPSPQQLHEWFLRGASGGSCPYVIHTGDRAGQTCGRAHTQHRCFSCVDNAWHAEFGDDVELPRGADLLKSRIAIFDLDFDAILSAMYALSVSAEGDYYRCDPRIAAAALDAS